MPPLTPAPTSPRAPRSRPARPLTGRPRWRAAATLLGLALAACGDAEDSRLPTLGGGGGTGGGTGGGGTTGSAQLRLVHAIPDGPTIDLRVDTAAAVVTGLAFRQATPAYLAVPAGDRRLRVLLAGAVTPAIDLDATLATGSATTLIATGLAGTASTQAFVLSDTNSAPASGQVRLRVAHAAPTLGQVDVYVSAPDATLPTTPTVTGATFRSASNYLSLTAGAYRVRLTPSGLRTPVLVDVTSPTLAAGTVAKAIAMDSTRTASGTLVPATAVVVVDRTP